MKKSASKDGFFKSLSSTIQKWRFEKKYGKQIFLIYSMGKVGSSTVKACMDHFYPDLPSFQIHFLSDYWLKERLPSMTSYFQVHIKWADDFFEFRKKNPDARLKIITLVREPVVRDLSDIFENGREYFNTDNIENISEEIIIEKARLNDFSYTLEWFDNEFHNWTGVDIYSLPFDRNKGYSCWKLKDFDLLCIKLEKLNEVMEEAMKELSGFPLSASINANNSERKPGKSIYRNVVNNFRLTESQAQKVFGSKLLNHFYSPEEISGLRAKWVS